MKDSSSMSWIMDSARPHFDKHPDEEFMKYFGGVFQIVFASTYIYKNMTYSYYILKPYRKPSERYGIGEIVAIYSPYPRVQARIIDVLIELQQSIYSSRVHQVWNILITDNPNTEQSLEELTRDKDLEVYSIPFSRQDLETKPNATFIHDRLVKYIQGRDLFNAQSALRSNLFFFGRDDLVNTLISAVEKGQNFGLFGLRKIGKTSLLYALEIYLERMRTHTVIHIDSQTPAIYLKKWDSLLAHIYKRLTSENMQFSSSAEIAQKFDDEIKTHPKKILLIFDEVENISMGGLSPAKHWDEDFLPFWGALRAAHQDGKMTIGVAGVNPYIFEVPLVMGKDNPFLLGVTNVDVGFLNEQAIKIMVKTIANFMGLEVEGAVIPWLYTQYGGHPLLTRKACSLIYNKAHKSSGDVLTLADFDSRQEWLDQQLGQDVMNILVVLIQHYPDEFDHLLAIAKGDDELFSFLHNDPEHLRELSHLLSYNILKEDGNKSPVFVIEALRRFLITSGESAKIAIQTLASGSKPTQYGTIPIPEQLDLWTRLNRARNNIEPQMRLLIKRALLFKYGQKKALQRVLSSFPSTRQSDLIGYDIDEIFGGESKALYLLDLKIMICKDWELFQHVFGNDKKVFEFRMDKLNSDGRADAHANKIAEKRVVEVEIVANDLLNQMSSFIN